MSSRHDPALCDALGCGCEPCKLVRLAAETLLKAWDPRVVRPSP